MRNGTLVAIALIFMISNRAWSQETVLVDTIQPTATSTPSHLYKIRPAIDIPVTVAFAAESFYGMSVIYGRDQVPQSEVMALSRDNINKFDRPISHNYDEKARALSDKFFYGSMPLPLVLMLDKRIRKDGLRVGLLFLETMGTTGVIYTTSAMLANRFRPYAYNPEVPIETRTRGGARNSFFAGHPAVVASSCFFIAQVYTSYHPEMKHKWVVFSLAGAAAVTTGLLRLKAGQHFKTDVITGLTVGTLVGNLVPYIHKNKNMSANKLALMPNIGNGTGGFTAIYRL